VNDLNAQDRPWLSIILPAHNEEQRLPPCLEQIDAFLKTQSFTVEVIIVENGSQDRTYDIAQEYAKKMPYIRPMTVTTRGKGLAVRAGMLAARGEYRFMCDVDLSMPIEGILDFLPPRLNGFDVAIATREGPGAKRVNEPEYRHMIGRVNNWIIKVTAVREFEDTQCGFKMFSRAAAEDLFNVQRTTGIGFDVELIYIALRRKYDIREVPITWYANTDSKIRVIQDSLKMLREIWDIRQNWKKGLYARPTDGQYTT
jgi:glycosyltransferase involved in cell wall biosynthesis